jgi:hypothetical protein
MKFGLLLSSMRTHRQVQTGTVTISKVVHQTYLELNEPVRRNSPSRKSSFLACRDRYHFCAYELIQINQFLQC